jgi:hypothetical protein
VHHHAPIKKKCEREAAKTLSAALPQSKLSNQHRSTFAPSPPFAERPGSTGSSEISFKVVISASNSIHSRRRKPAGRTAKRATCRSTRCLSAAAVTEHTRIVCNPSATDSTRHQPYPATSMGRALWVGSTGSRAWNFSNNSRQGSSECRPAHCELFEKFCVHAPLNPSILPIRFADGGGGGERRTAHFSPTSLRKKTRNAMISLKDGAKKTVRARGNISTQSTIPSFFFASSFALSRLRVRISFLPRGVIAHAHLARLIFRVFDPAPLHRPKENHNQDIAGNVEVSDSLIRWLNQSWLE